MEKICENIFLLWEETKSENETLKMQAARISRKATFVALKHYFSKELSDNFEKVIDNLDSEAHEVLRPEDNIIFVGFKSTGNYIGDMLKIPGSLENQS